MPALRAGSALSEHPVASQAVGECVGGLLETGGTGPDLLLVVVTPPLAGALEDVTGAVRHLLGPRVLLACTSPVLHGGAREVEDVAAMTMFALWDVPGGVRPVRLPPPGAGGGDGTDGMPAGSEGTVLLLGDRHCGPATDLAARVGARAPALGVVGGPLTAARGADRAVLVLDDGFHRDGAVGALFAPEAGVRTLVAPGTRPIGEPLTVTAASAGALATIGGAPALDRLREALATLGPEDGELASGAVYLARTFDEDLAPPLGGQAVVRRVLGAVAGTGSVALEALGADDPSVEVPVGSTVQFHLRDARSVDADLRRRLAGVAAEGVLLLTGEGRSGALLLAPDHDPGAVAEQVPGAALAGVGLAEEIAPLGRVNRAHRGAAVLALFGGR